MERLIRRSNVGEALPRNHINLMHMDTTSESHLDDIFERLAEYEDTGLEPSQIAEIDRLYAEQCKEVARLKEYLDFWQQSAEDTKNQLENALTAVKEQKKIIEKYEQKDYSFAENLKEIVIYDKRLGIGSMKCLLEDITKAEQALKESEG